MTPLWSTLIDFLSAPALLVVCFVFFPDETVIVAEFFSGPDGRKARIASFILGMIGVVMIVASMFV